MKPQSFFIGPNDEDTTVHVRFSLNDLKFIHGTLVDYSNERRKTSKDLDNVIIYLEHVIKETLMEKEK